MKTFLLLFTALALAALAPAASAQGTLTIANGTVALQNSGQLATTAHLTITGTLSTDAGTTLLFNGSGNQDFTPAAGQTLDDLTVDKPAGDLVLQGPLAVAGTVTITQGDLDLNGFQIDLGATGTFSETAGHTVKSTSGTITATRTLDQPANDNVAGLGAEISSSANLGQTTVTRGHAMHLDPDGDPTLLRYFDINPTNNRRLNATFVFHYDERELGGLGESALHLLRSTNRGTTWTNEGGTPDPNANTITLSGLDAFSRWTVGGETQPGGGAASVLRVNVDPIHTFLDVVTVEIFAGDIAGGLPVTDLYGVGFKLHYDTGRLTPNQGSLVAGSFLANGDTPLSFEQHDLAGGTISISVTRTNGTGVTGEGPVATVTFDVPNQAPPGDAVFTLSEILAIDASGNEITMTSQGNTTTIGGVWPGDTDNNCTVEADDLLPIGVSFGQTGPARPGGFDISWGAKAFSPWPVFAESYVDATGDGVINQNDVLPIGLNYLQTRSTPECGSVAAAKGQAIAEVTLPVTAVGSIIPLYLNATAPVSDLLGVAFQMHLPPEILAPSAVRAGALLDDGDLLSFERFDAQTGLLDAAFTRKGTNPPAHGTGTLVEVELEVVGAMAAPATLALETFKLSAADGTVMIDPATVELSLEGTGTATATEDEAGVPQTFTLHGAYPNPFNPSTTIVYDLPTAAAVTLVVYDVLGREVRRVAVGGVGAGARHQIRFEAGGLASGTYLYRVVARMADRQETQTGRVTLLK